MPPSTKSCPRITYLIPAALHTVYPSLLPHRRPRPHWGFWGVSMLITCVCTPLVCVWRLLLAAATHSDYWAQTPRDKHLPTAVYPRLTFIPDKALLPLLQHLNTKIQLYTGSAWCWQVVNIVHKSLQASPSMLYLLSECWPENKTLQECSSMQYPLNSGAVHSTDSGSVFLCFSS